MTCVCFKWDRAGEACVYKTSYRGQSAQVSDLLVGVGGGVVVVIVVVVVVVVIVGGGGVYCGDHAEGSE